MSDTQQNTTDQLDLPAGATWRESVELFEAEASDWLTPADAPQIMALRSIAAQLDGGKFQAALISQFTLIHRALLGRRPGGNPTPDGPPPGAPTDGMFGLFGGVAGGGQPWRADA